MIENEAAGPGTVKPKKILGQYFLKNTTAVMQSINALRLEAGEVVIEIGPGTGALTGPLSKQCLRVGCELIAVEKDEELAANITLPNTRVVVGDILIELPRLTENVKKYKIIGNIPYYITGHLLRVISELKNKPAMTVLMIQREVAERICAKPGEMSLLAAATQIWAEPKLLLVLKPSDFEPQPAVYSAVIELRTKNGGLTAGELTNYFTALHHIFKQPRKMLVNNLMVSGLSRIEALNLITSLNLAPTCRPQDLTTKHCLAISRVILK